MADKPTDIEKDEYVSYDDFSYTQHQNIVQESDKESFGTIGIHSSSFIVNNIVYPPCVSGGQNDLETRFHNQDPLQKDNRHNQSAKVKRYDSSSSSDEPEEETVEGHDSTVAFVPSGSGKNIEARVTSDQVETEIPEQRMHFIGLNIKEESCGNKMALSKKTYEFGPESCHLPEVAKVLQSMDASGLPRERKKDGLEQGLSHASVRGEIDNGDDARIVYKREAYSDNREMVHNPEYKTYRARLESYINWPHKTPSIESMANAGFFHVKDDTDVPSHIDAPSDTYVPGNTNVSGQTEPSGNRDAPGDTCAPGNTDTPDLVQCYKCGNTLEQFTPADDPVEEHDKHYPGCKNTKWV